MAVRATTRRERYDLARAHSEDDASPNREPPRPTPTRPHVAWMERKASAFWDSPPHVFEAELRRRKAEQARC
jgi:hypothetical protein